MKLGFCVVMFGYCMVKQCRGFVEYGVVQWRYRSEVGRLGYELSVSYRLRVVLGTI